MKNSFTEYVMSSDDTIRSVISRLNTSGLQIVFLQDAKGAVIGTITDGDIRRTVFKNTSPEKRAISIANRKFKFASKSTPSGEILFMMKKHHIRQIPVLDSKRRLVRVFTYEEMFNQMIELPVVIFAGGRGERLRPYTKNTPKPLLNIGEKSIVESIIERFATQGFFNLHLSLNYKSGMVKNRIEAKFPHMFNEDSFIIEKTPLGTAGSLSRLKGRGYEFIMTHNGDILSDVNFRDVMAEHMKRKNSITCVVIPYESQIPFGTVDIKGSRIDSVSEKPVHRHFILAGINLFSDNVISGIRSGARTDMDKVINSSIHKGMRVGFYLHKGFWMDIGDKDAFIKAQSMFGGIK